jgi:hypothetical protein
MDSKLSDHAYHRSRIDAHIGGAVWFAAVVAVLAFLVGDKFKPFQEGAQRWSSTLLIWDAKTDAWIPAKQMWFAGELHTHGDQYMLTPMRPPVSPATFRKPPKGVETSDMSAGTASPEGQDAPSDPGSDTGSDGNPSGGTVEVSPPSPAPGQYLITRVGDQTSSLLVTKEIYPVSYSVVVVFASVMASLFLYSCARRQTYLMNSVYAEDDESRPYDRPWKEIRVTFWALFLVLLGVLFLFMM